MLLSGDIKVLLATKPVDFRKQADSLAALVQEALGADPFCGAVYVFRWPRIEDGVLALSATQLSALLEGLDITRVVPREVVRPEAAS
jgi:transposase